MEKEIPEYYLKIADLLSNNDIRVTNDCNQILGKNKNCEKSSKIRTIFARFIGKNNNREKLTIYKIRTILERHDYIVYSWYDGPNPAETLIGAIMKLFEKNNLDKSELQDLLKGCHDWKMNETMERIVKIMPKRYAIMNIDFCDDDAHLLMGNADDFITAKEMIDGLHEPCTCIAVWIGSLE